MTNDTKTTDINLASYILASGYKDYKFYKDKSVCEKPPQRHATEHWYDKE